MSDSHSPSDAPLLLCPVTDSDLLSDSIGELSLRPASMLGKLSPSQPCSGVSAKTTSSGERSGVFTNMTSRGTVSGVLIKPSLMVEEAFPRLLPKDFA
jgi:hypothetical protein